MKKIPVENLKQGMAFTKAVYTDTNNVLVGANIPVKEDDIKKLMRWGVSYVETAGEPLPSDGTASTAASLGGEKQGETIIEEYNRLLKKRGKLIEIHNHASRTVSDIYEAIKKDRGFETKELQKTALDIINIMNDNYNAFIFLYGLDEGKDPMVTHAVDVTFYSLIIGMALKYSPERLKKLALGALMTNAGMMKVPIYILHKQSDLSDQEYNQVKTHPLLGYKALMNLGDFDEEVASVSLQHHEQYDGKGYPRGLKGNEIGEFARIVSIADSYEAQITTRSYREKIDFYHAMKNLLSSGVNRFDPVLLRLFLSMLSVYPIGSLVRLNDNSVGVVIGSVPEKPLRPILKIIFDSEGKRTEEVNIVNLLSDTSLYITKALDEKELGINLFDVL